ncbi:hypothetical protein EMCG_03337 [[Emmonsia] crescens]|uniref:Extracellular membrane protein CFEM domain-containing protein n=1 Tax=[Emmonsia] crescens TaxID=73230 RepID=A0A0G2J0C0_9EURO|nr:hypothetical protein EMCG_03337 [Emmonsia crescens UAMH 3008]
MKCFAIFALAGLLASVSALPQETSSPVAKCASECKLDVCCRAKCYNVPCPSEDMANETTQCAMKCPQGSGTPEDTAAYAKCQTDCINTHFFNGGEGPSNPNQTGGAGSPGSANNSGGASPSGGEATGTGSPTGGSTSSPSPSAAAAAINTQLGSSAAGIVGLLMAALAL